MFLVGVITVSWGKPLGTRLRINMHPVKRNLRDLITCFINPVYAQTGFEPFRVLAYITAMDKGRNCPQRHSYLFAHIKKKLRIKNEKKENTLLANKTLLLLSLFYLTLNTYHRSLSLIKFTTTIPKPNESAHKNK